MTRTSTALSPQASGRWSDLGHPMCSNGSIPGLGFLGPFPAGTPSGTTRHRRHGQQDRPDRLGCHG